jgi:hypothetical protein
MTEKVTVTVKTTRTLVLPTLPNFIRTEAGELVDISSLTEEQLREIGSKWTEALVRKARERRCAKTAEINRKIQKESR